MDNYSVSHLSDHALELDLTKFNSHEFASTASLLARIAEFDARRLHLPAGYPSMHAYCVHKLHQSDDSAYKRITAARVARRFPAVFDAVAEGRLHLTAVGQLSPHLTPDNAADLLEAASHKTKSEIAELLAQRFPRSEMLPLVTTSSCQLLWNDPSSRQLLMCFFRLAMHSGAEATDLAGRFDDESLCYSRVAPVARCRAA